MLNCTPVEATGYGSEEMAVISTGCHGDMARAHSALAFCGARTSKTSVVDSHVLYVLLSMCSELVDSHVLYVLLSMCSELVDSHVL